MVAAEVLRALRYLNVPLGLAVAGLALVTGGGTAYTVALVGAGAAVAAMSVPGGEVRERYGDWQRTIR